MPGQIAAVLMAVSAPAQDGSVETLRRQADAARLSYEAAQAQLLKAEIAESERLIAAQTARIHEQRARLAALGTPASVAPETTPATGPSSPTPTAVAEAAKATGTTVTTETTTTEGGKTVQQKTTSKPLSQEELAKGGATQVFGGIEFGVGIAYTLDTGKFQRVREAEVVNNIVRVNHSAQSSARIVLESHYFFTPKSGPIHRFVDSVFGLKNSAEETRWGFGPFIALQPGTDNVIDAIGTGVMLGLRRSQTGTDSFNLGIGALVDIDARTLGNGILEDQPQPAGDTLRYKRRSQLGLLLMSSYSF